MYTFCSGSWRWYFADRREAEKFLPHPEEAVAGSTLIRDFANRKVFYYANCYLKLEENPSGGFLADIQRRFFSNARSEYRALQCLAKHGIAAVRPVAYGVNGTNCMLITEEAKDCCSVSDYLSECISDGKEVADDFLRGWGRSVARLIRCGFYLPDFHAGNLLYNTADGSFTVVDPLGLQKNIFPRASRVWRMFKRQYGQIFEFMPKRALLILLSEYDQENPEKVWRQLMEYSANYVQKLQLAKRLKRFRRGSGFKVVDNIKRRMSRDLQLYSMEGAVSAEFEDRKLAESIWEQDYICSLYRLPLLHVIASSSDGKRLYRQAQGSGSVSSEERAELLERLAFTHLNADDFDCCRDADNRAVLYDRRFNGSER